MSFDLLWQRKLTVGLPAHKLVDWGSLSTHTTHQALGEGDDVGETSLFLTLSGASALLVSAWIVKNPSGAASQAAAHAFYWISITLSVVAFLWITLDVFGCLPVNTISSWWLRVLIYRGWLVIGTALNCAALLILNGSVSPRVVVASDATRTFLTSPYVLKGISLSVSISFVCAEIGKLTHDADMRQLFLQSGYSSWFLYFIIIAETAGAIGYFFHERQFPLRSAYQESCLAPLVLMYAIEIHFPILSKHCISWCSLQASS